VLGSSYLLTISLQHCLFVGFAVLFTGEILKKTEAVNSALKFSGHLCLLGLSLINLSFLHYAFSEELLLIQVLVSLSVLALLFFKEKFFLAEDKKKSKSLSVYLILVVLLAFELID